MRRDSAGAAGACGPARDFGILSAGRWEGTGGSPAEGDTIGLVLQKIPSAIVVTRLWGQRRKQGGLLEGRPWNNSGGLE